VARGGRLSRVQPLDDPAHRGTNCHCHCYPLIGVLMALRCHRVTASPRAARLSVRCPATAAGESRVHRSGDPGIRTASAYIERPARICSPQLLRRSGHNLGLCPQSASWCAPRPAGGSRGHRCDAHAAIPCGRAESWSAASRAHAGGT
jgi:hypothetical protein